MTHYVVGFMFDWNARHVVLVRKNKPAWQAGKLNGVGGKVERGETLLEAMAREFWEETGIETDPTQWVNAGVMKGGHDEDTSRSAGYTVSIFFTHGDVSLASSTTDEAIDVYDVDDIPALNVVPNLRWIVPYLLNFGESRTLGVEVRYA